MTSLLLLLVFCALPLTNAQQGCSNECYDYNRICPAVKDRSFYDMYKQQHQSGSLGVFSDAPLPPEPDCNNFFYKYGCPRSCGSCTPCEVVDTAYVQKLIAQVEGKVTAGDATCTNSISQLQQKMNQGDPKMLAMFDELHQKMMATDDSLQASIASLGQDMGTTSRQLELKLMERIEEVAAQVAQQPVNCNPCTQKLGNIGNGQTACLPKYDVIYETKTDCSCDCGEGTLLKEKKCVAYEEENGKCKQVATFIQNCPEGPASKTQVCNNGACTVTRIVEKTATARNSQTNDAMRYKAITKSGKSCKLGLVKKSNNKQRSNGKKDTYDQGDIEDSVCSDLCLAKDEVFEYVEITINGRDGWKTDYIELTINGEEQKYTNTNWLDDKETLKYTKK